MDSASVISDYVSRREQNILEIRKELGYNYNPGALDSQRKFDVKRLPARRTSGRKKRNKDTTYQARDVHIPLERRKSLRIAKKEPFYAYPEFVDNNDIEDIRRHLKRVVPSKMLPNVSVIDGYRTREITEKDIDNIAKSCRDKKNIKGIGTTCHQCRQCSADTKTFCRNINCTTVSGQLCGPCLHVRYGEDLETTLKDPKWICPYCRGICNCSICRRREGQEPTGILSHIALKRGYESVHHYLNDRGVNPEITESDNETLTISDTEDCERDIVVQELEIYQYFDIPGDVVENFNAEDLDIAGMFKVQHNTEFGIPALKDKNEVLYKYYVNGETKLITVEDKTNAPQLEQNVPHQILKTEDVDRVEHPEDLPQESQQNLKDLEKTENVDFVQGPEIALFRVPNNLVMTDSFVLLGFNADLKPVISSFAYI